MLNVSPVPARAASLAQASGQPPQTFNDSLLAASKSYASTGSENQAGTGSGRPQKPVSQDGKLPPSASHVRPVQSPAPPQKTVEQQVPLGKQTRLVNQALIRMELPFREPDHSASTATGQAMRDGTPATSLPIEPKLAQPVAKLDSIPSSHAKKENDLPQAAAVLPLVSHALQTAADLTNAFTLLNPLSTNANVFAKAGQAVLSDAIQKAISSSVPNVAPTTLPSAVLTAVPVTDSSAVSSPVSSAAPSVAPTALPSAAQRAVPVADSSAVSSPVSSAAPSVAPTTLPSAAQRGVPIADLSAVSNPAPSAAPAVISSASEKPLPEAIPTALSGTFPTSDASFSGRPGASLA